MTIELTLPAPAAPGVAGATSWLRVCPLSALERERGVAALVDGAQVAVFRTHDDSVYAVQNLDPFSGAQVVSRGIVGSRGEAPTVASPMYKQVFDLRTGACLDGVGSEPQHLLTWAVRLVDDHVEIASAPTSPLTGAGSA